MARAAGPRTWRWPLPNGVTISQDRAGRWRVDGRFASAQQASAAMLHTIMLDLPESVLYRSSVEAQGRALVGDLSDASWSLEDAAAALAADSEEPGFLRPQDPEADLREWQAWAAEFARSKPGRLAAQMGVLLYQATAVVVGEHYRASKSKGFEDLWADEDVEVMGGSYCRLDPEHYAETFDKLRARLAGLRRSGHGSEVWVAGLFFRWEHGSHVSVAEELFVRLHRHQRRPVEKLRAPSRDELEEFLDEAGYDPEEVAEVLGRPNPKWRKVKRKKTPEDAAQEDGEAVKKVRPVPLLLWCPECGARHVDVGRWEGKVHYAHACQECGMVWRPAVVATVGVRFLPGFKNGGGE